MDIAWMTRDQISQIVQDPLSLAMPIGAVSTMRARPLGEVAAARNDLWLGQILGIGDALGGIGQVFSGPWHSGALRGLAPQLPNDPRICRKYAAESRSKPNSYATVSENTLDALLEHWRECGLPAYAKFDNDTVFQGAHQFPDTFGRVTRACLSLGVTPVFVPPGEMGFQADIESYNGRWQSKVWRRFRFTGLTDVVAHSERFVAACRKRSAARIEAAPPRQPFPRNWKLDLQARLRGTVIFLRRTDEHGFATFLGHRYPVSSTWCHRLIRAEVNLTCGKIRIHPLRRREPNAQPLLITHRYRPPQRRFHE